MGVYFFPRDKIFWLYHCGTLCVVSLIQGTIIYFWQDEKALSAVAGSVWILLFTLGMLWFRFIYKQRSLQYVATVKMILGSLLFSLVMGAIISLAMLSVVAPIFWSNLISAPDIVEHKISITQRLSQMFIGGALQNQLFIAGWIFIYINIVSGRRVRAAELNNLRLQNSLKEAQLANLSNQLNPHFLFNALNNIRFTIHEDQNKADAMLTGLSEMLRYSLESSKLEKVILSEELEMIDRYIALIKVQMEDRLMFELDIPRALHKYLIPPMVLQLLVENAVKHGIDKLRDGGIIKLSVVENNQTLTFSIINTLGNIKSVLPGKNSTGIGLMNIRSRLNLLYGNLAQLDAQEFENNFVVSLTLPREISE